MSLHNKKNKSVCCEKLDDGRKGGSAGRTMDVVLGPAAISGARSGVVARLGIVCPQIVVPKMSRTASFGAQGGLGGSYKWICGGESLRTKRVLQAHRLESSSFFFTRLAPSCRWKAKNTRFSSSRLTNDSCIFLFLSSSFSFS